MKEKLYTIAILVAAGKGKRMGSDICKQFLKLGEKEILLYTIERFQKCQAVDEIVLVTGEDYISYLQDILLPPWGFTKISGIVAGGKERQDSVWRGIEHTKGRGDILMVHDGVRPFVTVDAIDELVTQASKHGACVFGVPVKDTIRICDEAGFSKGTPDRNSLWAIQTPQAFQRNLLVDAFEKARNDEYLGTDEGSLVERLGIPVKVIQGSFRNIKITTPEDLVIGRAFLEEGEL